jgi:thiamine-phosphate diphosphorylase
MSLCLAPRHVLVRHVLAGGGVILHAIVSDLDAAQRAVDAGATVVQLRLKGATTEEVVAVGGAFGGLDATFVVNDDVDAAIELGADGVHLGQGDAGAERALEAGLLLGISVANRREAAIAEYQGADYIGAGAIWATPSKEDAPAIGLDALREICMSVDAPVIAIGGIDASNAAECIRAGAAGVAVIRAAGDPALRAALDAAL